MWSMLVVLFLLYGDATKLRCEPAYDATAWMGNMATDARRIIPGV